jgi:uncharacterized DUF497 family protein
MRFDWDENKNRINIRKHGIDFADAVDIFKHPMLTLADGGEDYGEERWLALGWIKEVIGVVVYVERIDDMIRIISARQATKSEKRRYEQNVQN